VVKSAVQEVGPARVRLTIEVPFDELVYRAEDAEDPSDPSRPGEPSAPGDPSGPADPSGLRAFALAFADGRFEAAGLPDAFVTAVSAKVQAALREHDLVPLRNPEVEITGFGDGLPLTASLLVDRRPTVRLPPLHTVEVVLPLPDPELLEAQVEARLDQIRRQFVDLTPVDRPAERGDVVRLDLSAQVDGAHADWAPVCDVPVEVGADGILTELGDALVGLEPGGSTTVAALVPAGPDAGREALVTAEVREVMRAREPELDDELAAAAGPYTGVAHLRAHLRATLSRDRHADLLAAREGALHALVTAADVQPPPEAVRELAARMRVAIAADRRWRESSLVGFLEREGLSEGQFGARLDDQAAGRLSRQIVLDALADAERIDVSMDELRDAITRDMARAGVSARTYRRHLARDGVALRLYELARREKALTYLLKHVVVKRADGSAVTFEDLV
jgi:trigger factor